VAIKIDQQRLLAHRAVAVWEQVQVGHGARGLADGGNRLLGLRRWHAHGESVWQRAAPGEGR